jgi:hypothetical protein
MAKSQSGKKAQNLTPFPASKPVLLNTPEGKFAPGWDKPNAAIDRTKERSLPHRIEIGPGTPGRN